MNFALGRAHNNNARLVERKWSEEQKNQAGALTIFGRYRVPTTGKTVDMSHKYYFPPTGIKGLKKIAGAIMGRSKTLHFHKTSTTQKKQGRFLTRDQLLSLYRDFLHKEAPETQDSEMVRDQRNSLYALSTRCGITTRATRENRL
jgi:hypothetical protein